MVELAATLFVLIVFAFIATLIPDEVWSLIGILFAVVIVLVVVVLLWVLIAVVGWETIVWTIVVFLGLVGLGYLVELDEKNKK